VFQMDIAKVNQDVTIVVHVCCKLLFSIFQLFSTYVSSVFIYMLYMLSYLCCKYFIYILRMFAIVSSVFQVLS
jgi:hypothetical protein